MSLITCYECHKTISDLAAVCPGCGAPAIPRPSAKQSRERSSYLDYTADSSSEKRLLSTTHQVQEQALQTEDQTSAAIEQKAGEPSPSKFVGVDEPATNGVGGATAARRVSVEDSVPNDITQTNPSVGKSGPTSPSGPKSLLVATLGTLLVFVPVAIAASSLARCQAERRNAQESSASGTAQTDVPKETAFITREDAEGGQESDFDPQVLVRLQELVLSKARAKLGSQLQLATSQYLSIGSHKLAVLEMRISNELQVTMLVGVVGKDFVRVSCIKPGAGKVDIRQGKCREKLSEAFGEQVQAIAPPPDHASDSKGPAEPASLGLSTDVALNIYNAASRQADAAAESAGSRSTEKDHADIIFNAVVEGVRLAHPRATSDERGDQVLAILSAGSAADSAVADIYRGAPAARRKIDVVYRVQVRQTSDEVFVARFLQTQRRLSQAGGGLPRAEVGSQDSAEAALKIYNDAYQIAQDGAERLHEKGLPFDEQSFGDVKIHAISQGISRFYPAATGAERASLTTVILEAGAVADTAVAEVDGEAAMSGHITDAGHGAKVRKAFDEAFVSAFGYIHEGRQRAASRSVGAPTAQ